jgi:hypothetical protein
VGKKCHMFKKFQNLKTAEGIKRKISSFMYLQDLSEVLFLSKHCATFKIAASLDSNWCMSLILSSNILQNLDTSLLVLIYKDFKLRLILKKFVHSFTLKSI